MKPLNKRVWQALYELVDYTDSRRGQAESEHFEELLAAGADVSQHVGRVLEILLDYLEGRPVKARFALGAMYATAGAMAAFEEAKERAQHWRNEPEEMPAQLFNRHQCGDWGDLTETEQQQNELALKAGLRIVSVYTLQATGQKVCVLTEADRSRTTILLPAEL